MTTPSPINTLGVVTFGPCGENDQPLFCVNPGIPLRQALEHVSALLFCAKKLALDAALEKDGVCRRFNDAPKPPLDAGVR